MRIFNRMHMTCIKMKYIRKSRVINEANVLVRIKSKEQRGEN